MIPHVRILLAESHVNFASHCALSVVRFLRNRGERNNIWTCPPNGRLRFVLAASGDKFPITHAAEVVTH
ncbi:MAG: hypothetical protein ACTS4W_01675 [Candidatus Hodgkinia cicadicola]